MNHYPFNSLACPLDGRKLEPEGKSAFCDKKHCFDFDRYGALNLLPVQFKKSKEPGDSKEMVEARQRFLTQGFYKAISDKVNTIIEDHILNNDDAEDFSFLDAGCGEGYYTAELALHLLSVNDHRPFAMCGMDISKEAIIAASRRDKETSWCVGTNAHLPILPRSMEAVLSLFGFPVWKEFERVLTKTGIVVEVTTGADHLIELRKVLYEDIKDPVKSEIMPHGLKLISQERLTEELPKINSGYLEDLLIMTPHGYRATAARKEEALETDFPSMTLDTVFKIYALG